MDFFLVSTEGTGTYKNFKLCDRFKKKSCIDPDLNSTRVTNRQIHEISLSWKVKNEDTIFEKPMQVTEKEIAYHELQFTTASLKRAKTICGEVRSLNCFHIGLCYLCT